MLHWFVVVVAVVVAVVVVAVAVAAAAAVVAAAVVVLAAPVIVVVASRKWQTLCILSIYGEVPCERMSPKLYTRDVTDVFVLCLFMFTIVTLRGDWWLV